VAVIQYLGVRQVREILLARSSVNLYGSTNKTGGLAGKVTLWACSDASLPNIAGGTNNSIVASLDSSGRPATFNGNWTEITRNGLGAGTFTLGSSLTDFSFSEFLSSPGTAYNFFAIVVGFSAMANTDTINFQSISVCAGDIPTRPAPQTRDQVLNDCEQFYEQSYVNRAAVGTGTTYNALSAPMGSSVPNSGSSNVTRILENTWCFQYRALKRAVNPNVFIYSPQTGAVNNVAVFARVGASTITFGDDPLTLWGTKYIGDKNATYIPTGISAYSTNATDAFIMPAYYITYHYIVDARLGIV